ncbi:MAG: hypothetical protein WCS96_12535 [Victivallales bacterium]
MIREKGTHPNPNMSSPNPTTIGPSVQYVIFTLMNHRVRVNRKYADSVMYAAIFRVFGKKKNGGRTIMETQSTNIESFSMPDKIVSASQDPLGKKMAQSRGKAVAIDVQKRNLR